MRRKPIEISLGVFIDFARWDEYKIVAKNTPISTVYLKFVRYRNNLELYRLLASSILKLSILQFMSKKSKFSCKIFKIVKAETGLINYA